MADMIVKVQRPVASTDLNAGVLVYDKKRRIHQQMNGAAVLPFMGDRMKAYFYAWIKDGILMIGAEAPEQEW